MAIPIKAAPILSGEIADDFVRKAEEREKKFYNIPETEGMRTHMFYFDLLQLNLECV